MKRLRSGFTTGACAAAASKGAALLFLKCLPQEWVEIPFPDGNRIRFTLLNCGWLDQQKTIARCSVIKDAGDDPDVTNGAEIVATVHATPNLSPRDSRLVITGGKGVGVVTKPGLALPVGAAAINPVPLKMIEQAVAEALQEAGDPLEIQNLVVTISIPDGEGLALKTLNKRLGIIGGLSILGTTGVVVPISAEAWTATISSSMDVARECGVTEIVLSTGRTSERAVQEHFNFPEEALVQMGDYLEFSLKAAAEKHFKKVHLAGMWAKLLKGAQQTPQTHVRHGALDIQEAIHFLQKLTSAHTSIAYLEGSNTAREIYERLLKNGNHALIQSTCRAAQEYYQYLCGLPVHVYLVHASGKIVVSV